MSSSSISGVGGISGISGASRVSLSTPDPSAATVPTDTQAASANQADPLTTPLATLPPPTRFPWLSNLSAKLEAAAKQRPAFDPAPVLGDNVDKAA